MSQVKYSNGLYKTTSKAQDILAQSIFKSFSFPVYILTDLEQVTGNVKYSYFDTYSESNRDDVLVITVNRKGKIIE